MRNPLSIAEKTVFFKTRSLSASKDHRCSALCAERRTSHPAGSINRSAKTYGDPDAGSGWVPAWMGTAGGAMVVAVLGREEEVAEATCVGSVTPCDDAVCTEGTVMVLFCARYAACGVDSASRA